MGLAFLKIKYYNIKMKMNQSALENTDRVSDQPLVTGRSSTDEVISYIRGSVLSGDIKPGSRLVASKIAQLLGVTIVPVREAIHFLAGEGMVELLPLKGARIRQFDQAEIVSWWQVYLALTRIELHATAKAITKSPGGRASLLQAIEVIEGIDPSAEPLSFVFSLADFHIALNAISGEIIVREASRRLQVRFWTSFLIHYVPFDIYGPKFAAHYRAVADAVMRGDGHGAATLFEYHVAWSSSLIGGARPDPSAPWSP